MKNNHETVYSDRMIFVVSVSTSTDDPVKIGLPDSSDACQKENQPRGERLTYEDTLSRQDGHT